MKVAMIGTRGVPARYGGTETYVERISHYLASRGDEVIVYCKRSRNAAERAADDAATPPGIRRVEVPSIPTKHLDNFTRALLSTLHACFTPGVDVIQFNNAGPAFFAILPRLLGKKTVGAIRAIDSRRDKWNPLAQAFLRFCDYVIVKVPNATSVNGRFMRSYYLSRYGEDTVYIPNGVDLPGSVPAPDRIRQWGLDGRDYILFAARLEPEKGCHTLIAAYEMAVARTGTAVKLVIAGRDGFAEDYVRELKSHAGERIRFVGHVTGQALEELYGNACAFVLPSSVEGMSNSLLAAMANGLPVIVSDIPENTDVIADAPADPVTACPVGLSFRLEDAGDLADRLCDLLSDPEAAARRGELLREHARAHYTLDSMYERTRQLYLDVVSGKLGAGQVLAS